MNDFVEVRRAVEFSTKWLWLFVLAVATGAALAWSLSTRQAPTYEASMTLMLGSSPRAALEDGVDLSASELVIRTYADLALRQPVLQAVVDRLALEQTWRELRERVRVRLVDGTHLLEIHAEAGTLGAATAVADAIGHEVVLLGPSESDGAVDAEGRAFVADRLGDLREKIANAQARVDGLERSLVAPASGSAQAIIDRRAAIADLERMINAWEANYVQMLAYFEDEASAPNALTVVEPAQANPRPVRPRIPLNAIVGGALGWILSIGLALLLELRDDTLRGAAEVASALDTPVLGTIQRLGRRKLLQAYDPQSPVAEAYRIVRNNIEFGTADRPVATLVVTSPGPGEGKSVTAANLGIILAHAGLRAVVVDADLRNPVQHRLFGVRNDRGLVAWARFPDAASGSHLADTTVDGLRVLASGGRPPNPAELLRSPGVRTVLQRLSDEADIVIYDSPPALGLTDAGVLANRADGLVLVVEAGKTRVDAARRAMDELRATGANIVGVVLNRARRGGEAYRTTLRPPSPSASTMFRDARREA